MAKVSGGAPIGCHRGRRYRLARTSHAQSRSTTDRETTMGQSGSKEVTLRSDSRADARVDAGAPAARVDAASAASESSGPVQDSSSVMEALRDA